MGLIDILRRRKADSEPQGDDFSEDIIVPAEKCAVPAAAKRRFQRENVNKGGDENAADNKTE